MKVVADSLRDSAMNAKDDTESDLFCRSAFNRYYYAVFHLTKSALKESNLWPNDLSHKGLPEYLTGKALRKVKHALRQAGVFDSEGYRREKDAFFRLQKIMSRQAEILTFAYSIRCKADYDLDVKSIYIRGSLQFHSVRVEAAEDWVKDTLNNVTRLREALKELGIA
jgi:hypothetical protein